MKKVYFLAFAGLFSFFILMGSCNKKVQKDANQNLISESLDLWSIAANTNNPIDSVGLIHNLSLDYLSNSSEFPLNDIQSDMRVFTENWGYDSQYMLSKDSVNNILSEIKTVSENAIDEENRSSYFSDYVQTKISGSAAFNSYLSTAFSLIEINENDISSDSLIGISGVINEIRNLESEIMLSALEGQEKTELLATTSILRYSLAYWMSVAVNPSHPYYYALTDGSSSEKTSFHNLTSKFWQRVARGLTTVLADGLGGAIGGVAGAALGTAVGGPAGTVVGMASGIALLGGISSGAVAANWPAVN